MNRTESLLSLWSPSMSFSRREFIHMLAIGAASLGAPLGSSAASRRVADPYAIPAFGNFTILHFTDTHAQLLPTYFREPSANIGVGSAAGQAPHLVGEAFLRKFGIPAGSAEAYALTCLDFEEAAHRYGKIGGFAHLAALVKRFRAERPNRSLLLDGGDSWQGSATSLRRRGQDMVDAQKLLGVDMTTGHWEFTLGAERVKEIVGTELSGHIEFLAQNVTDATWGDRIFKPYAMREVNGIPVAVIGQAFPYTPIAHPHHLIPDWSFGINDDAMQKLVDEVRGKGAQVVVVLSHNGMDVDLKMASRVTGIDAILGGHTHDGMPAPSIIANESGKTLVINSGCYTKFLAVLDLDVKGGRVADFRFNLLPVFSNLIDPDREMATYIEKAREPYRARLEEKLAITESLLFRRGNFGGTFDQLIVDGLLALQDAEIALSPGFRWGTTLLPGDLITMEDLMTQTAITYPTVTLNYIDGAQIKAILEDIADNLYNPDPYYQQGGDMVRVGGLTYSMDVNASIGKRIDDLRVRGKPLDPYKKYKVAGWASVQEHPAGTRPIWDLMAEYLRSMKSVAAQQAYMPRLKGVTGNSGLAA